MALAIRRVNPESTFEKGSIVIGSQGKWYRPYHAAVVSEEQGQNLEDMVPVLHVNTENYGPVTSPSASMFKQFFTQEGVAAFKIDDPEISENFIDELERTNLNFKVLKSVSSYIKDFFYSAAKILGSTMQEEAVAESIAKYFYNNHASNANPDKKESKMFCSQFVYQGAQNAAMIAAVGKENLGLNERGVITKSFEEWRAEHIDKIRGAVREFPDELRHISSSVSPSRLTNLLNSLADKTQQLEQGKSANLPSNKPGFFSRAWSGIKSAFSSKPIEEKPLLTTESHSLDELGQRDMRMETAKKEADKVVEHLQDTTHAVTAIKAIEALSKDKVTSDSHNKPGTGRQ